MQIIKFKDQEFQKTQAYLEAGASRARLLEANFEQHIQNLKRLMSQQNKTHQK